MNNLLVVQKAVLNHLLRALLECRQSLTLMSSQEALKPATAYGKGDTLMLDVSPEVTISRYVRDLDSKVFFVTEESARGKWPDKPLCVIISDPTDRSSPFAKFITQFSVGKEKMVLGELFNQPDAISTWERDFGGPVSITGPTTSVTCVWEDGSIIFTILLNYITGELVLVANDRIVAFDTIDKSDSELELDSIMGNGRPVIFPKRKIDASSRNHLRFVTFLQKSAQYSENLADSMVIMNDPKDSVHYDAPGGPSRPLYLSDFQPAGTPIGFILANGEKLPEWMGWLAFVKAAHTQHHEVGLRLFEVFTSRPHMRDGILMSTSPHYSLFHQLPGKEVYGIDIGRLRHFPQPSQFRSMLVVVPDWNFPMVNALSGHNYREIIL